MLSLTRRLLIFALLATCAVQAKPTYFETSEGFAEFHTPYYMGVNATYEMYPAHQAGLRKDDRVIGIDGHRIYNKAEYDLVRFLYHDRDYLHLDVIRKGALRRVELAHPMPFRRGGFYEEMHGPSFTEMLQRYDLDFSKLQITDAEGESLTGDLLEANIKQVLAMFPGRAQAIYRKALEEDAARPWLAKLLNAYMLLRFEKFAAATEVLEAMPDKAPDAFLAELARFYAAVAKEPVDDKGMVADQYGVGRHFLVVCYPYPVVVERPSKPFTFDPRFQEVYDQATLHPVADQEVIDEVANRYVSDAAPGNVSRYLGSVRAALIARARHGGWPYRSSLIWTDDERKVTLDGLKKRWESHPNERVLLAFAILCPAAINRDEPLFRQAYDTIAAAGARERRLARRFIHHLQQRWGPRPAMAAIIADEQDRERASIYRWLEQVSYRFVDRRHRSDSESSGGRVALWVHNRLAVVGHAIGESQTIAQRESLINESLAATDIAMRQRGFAELTKQLAYWPRQSRFGEFIALAKKMPPGEVFDALSHIMGAHHGLQNGNRLELSTVFNEYFYTIEADQYRSLMDELKAVKKADPKQMTKIEAFFQRAATPSSVLLLVQTLRELDQAEAAERYRRKVIDFYDNMVSSYRSRRNRYMSWKALRDFASIPGFVDEAQRFRQNAVRNNYDSGYVLAAIVDGHKGDYEGLISNMHRSIGKRVGKDTDIYLFGGEQYKDVGALRKAVLRDLIERKKLTKAQLARLRKSAGLEVGQVEKQLKREKALGNEVKDEFGPYIWFIGKEGELGFRHAQTGQTSFFPQVGEVFDIEDFRTIVVLPLRQKIWLATNHGLFSINRQDWSWEEEAPDQIKRAAVSKLSVNGDVLTVVYGDQTLSITVK